MALPIFFLHKYSLASQEGVQWEEWDLGERVCVYWETVQTKPPHIFYGEDFFNPSDENYIY